MSGTAERTTRRPAPATDWRFSAFYAGVFLTLGLYLPYWPLYLESRALGPESIALVLAVATWSKVVTTPAIGRAADRTGRHRSVSLFSALGALVCFAGLSGLQGLWPILLLHLAAYGLFYALIPLAEAQTLAASLARRLDYGRMRLWGSVAFVAGTLGGGAAIERFGGDSLIWLLSASLALVALAAARLPASPRPGSEGAEATAAKATGGLAPLLTPRFLTLLLVAALLQASHATYYVFSAVYWRASGLSPSLIGWLWAEGVAAEVLIFAFGTALVARLGGFGLLLLGGVAGVVRWTLSALPPDPALLLAVQLLHGLTFGAAHLGAMRLITLNAPAELRATAQSLHSALSGGLVMGLATLSAGWLYKETPATAFLAMAGVSGAGLALLLALRLRAGRSYFVA